MLLEFHYKIRRRLPRCERNSRRMAGLSFSERERKSEGEKEKERAVRWERGEYFEVDSILKSSR